MSLLARTQQDFLACVLDDAAPLPPGWNARRAAGMVVYRNAYRARLVDVLRDTFERTARLVGDAAFRQAAAHHLITHPPASWTIDLAGDGFPETCAELFVNDPDVAEVAWLEWAMHSAFTAGDCEPLMPAGFAVATAGYETGQWEGLCLNFMPGTTVRPVTHDLVKLWATLAEPVQPSDVVELRETQWVLVWREAERPTFVLVPAVEGRALADLWGGGTFGALCASLADTIDPNEAATKAGAMLLNWLEMGVIWSIRSQSRRAIRDATSGRA